MKRFLIFIVIVGILAAGFYAYRQFSHQESVNAWSLIPEKALIVYETNQFSKTWEKLPDKKIWKTLSSIPEIKKLSESLQKLDSTGSKSNLIELLTNNNKLIISLFPINKSELGGLFVLEINNIEQHAAISNLLENHYKRKTRKYNGFTITEVKNKENNAGFSFIFYKNYFIGSNTPFLVEDAIRTISETDYSTFQDANKKLFSLAKLQKDDGNLYINTSEASKLIRLFYKGPNNDISFFNKVASSTFMDISTTDSEISLNGFSFLETDDNYLNIFENNPANSITISNLVTNSAYALKHYSFSKPDLFLANLRKYRISNEADFSISENELKQYDINTDDFAQWLGDEIGIYNTNDGKGKFLAIKTADNVLAGKQIQDIANRVATAKQDSIYSEIYDENEIIFFPLENFPYLVFGKTAEGFSDIFYLNNGEWLIFSNDLQNLKNLIDDIKNEDTWGKSLKFNQFLKVANKESNLSYFLNLKNAWSELTDILNDDWREFALANESIIKEFELLGFQFSNVDEKYFTHISILHPGEYKKRRGSTSLLPELTITFDHDLVTKPYIVSNHIENTKEVILQDSANTLYLISGKLDILWSDSLSELINTPIHQVDYFNNGKLQYLFGTGNQINLIDRNGKKTDNYPLVIGTETLKTLSVVDYNKTKKYRWALSNAKGEIFLTDKKGESLKNWSPNTKKYLLDKGIQHTRILGKDLILACLDEGIIDIFSRKGYSYPGFPINFEKDIDDQFIINPGTSFDKSKATFLSRDGEIISVNLRGKFLKRDQLVQGTKNARYGILKDVSSNKFLISVMDQQGIIILNSEGDPKFKKSYINNGDLLLQYYYFGSGNELIFMTDLLQEFTYIYDGSGNLINSIPIENGREVSVLYSRNKNEFELYTTFRNRLDLYRFSIK